MRRAAPGPRRQALVSHCNHHEPKYIYCQTLFGLAWRCGPQAIFTGAAAPRETRARGKLPLRAAAAGQTIDGRCASRISSSAPEMREH